MPPAVIGAIISGGAALGSSAIASHGQSVAADKQAEAIEKGIALQKQMYEQDRADFGPYRALGSGAVGNLAYLSGIDMPAASSPQNPATEQQPKVNLAELGTDPNATMPWNTALQKSAAGVNQAYDAMNSGKLGPTIKVSKNGQTRVIPASLLPKALQSGYQQVQ